MFLLPTVTLVLVLVQLGSSTVPSQGQCNNGIEIYMQNLPDQVIANYICDGIQLGRKKRSDPPMVRRQTSQLSQVQNKFGAENIRKLNQTLSAFFDDDVANYFDLLMNQPHEIFYWAERKVLRTILTRQGVTDYESGIQSIKYLRDVDRLYEELRNMDISDLCSLSTMLKKLGEPGRCAVVNFGYVIAGDPCHVG